jgi:hypothetical protein
VEYGPATGLFSMRSRRSRSPTPTACMFRARSPSPLGALKAEQPIAKAFRTGAGMGWHEHDEDVFRLYSTD